MSGDFNGVASDGTSVYAVGHRSGGNAGSQDYLVEKFDANGNFIWRSSFGTAGLDELNDVVTVGGRVFAVGYTSGDPSGAGGEEAVLFEINAANGAVVKTLLETNKQLIDALDAVVKMQPK